MMGKISRGILLLLCFFVACRDDDPGNGLFELLSAFMGTTEIALDGGTHDLPVDRSVTLVFSRSVNPATTEGNIKITDDSGPFATNIAAGSDARTVVLQPQGTLKNNTRYTIEIAAGLKGAGGESISPFTISFTTIAASLTLVSASVGNLNILTAGKVVDVPPDLSLRLVFSAPVNANSFERATTLAGPGETSLAFSYSDNNQTIDLSAGSLQHLSRFQFHIGDNLESAGGETFAGFTKLLYTRADPTPKFPVMADDALLTLVQEQTFKYFWDFAHPASGMARERNTSANTVTSGGSGFGIMTLIVGMERGFITREEGLQRMDKILTFLEGADRFHGAWSHWINGDTGDVIPFSDNDNGGDLVETSFLVQGLLTFRQYLEEDVADEKTLIDRINVLWHEVEWDWYTRDGQDVLYWHWSPDKQWTMNHPIRGYNEALITYFLAAASPTHAIAASVYHNGWADGGAIQNGKEYYGISLPLGYDYGGPLFFAHYSFLGLDPRNLSDSYANYWTQNVNHTRINHAYAVANPRNFVGYSGENWGLTASDNHQGYSAHSPTNDLGVITPTAALSSFPYTPDESTQALKFFYYTLGDRLWGEYGFYDAFNISEGWTASSYLAIDQGPIIIMLENYRTGLLWDLFMSSPEVQTSMNRLGFTR